MHRCASSTPHVDLLWLQTCVLLQGRKRSSGSIAAVHPRRATARKRRTGGSMLEAFRGARASVAARSRGLPAIGAIVRAAPHVAEGMGAQSVHRRHTQGIGVVLDIAPIHWHRYDDLAFLDQAVLGRELSASNAASMPSPELLPTRQTGHMPQRPTKRGGRFSRNAATPSL
jgi:hypothetical protein